MTTASTITKPKQVTYMHGEIEIIRKRLHDLQGQIKMIWKDKEHAKTYRDSLCCEANMTLLRHEHAVLSLRMYDLMEGMTYRQTEDESSLDF